MASPQFYITDSLQNFGFSEHPRTRPKALTRVITENDVPIGKTSRSQYVDFHTSCESPHNKFAKLNSTHGKGHQKKEKSNFNNKKEAQCSSKREQKNIYISSHESVVYVVWSSAHGTILLELI